MKELFIIVGAGSIGRRHAKNLSALGLSTIICDTNIKRAKLLAREIGSPKYYANYKLACRENPSITGAIIATPSQYHVSNARFFADKEINIFIEKPLATEMKGIDDLVKSINSKKVVTMMGQSYRFHEGYLHLKKLLEESAIGGIRHVNLLSGQYLPDWHPKMDYRTEYAAQKKLGGGALFTSMSHIFDSVVWLFGEVKELSGWKAKLGNLEIDVDDSVFCLMKTKRNIVVMCETDFLQRTSKHILTIVGEKGTIEADFVAHNIKVELSGKKPITKKYAFDPNKRYVGELKHFIKLIKEKKVKHDLDIYAGQRVVKLLLSKAIVPITKI